MKLVQYEYNDQRRTGVVDGDNITPLVNSDMQAVIESGNFETTDESVALDAVRILAPVRPSKLLAIGRNYVEHAQEVGADVPTKPLIFAVVPSAVIAHEETIQWSPSITNKVDWEGELAVIIGKTARNVNEAEALDFVFGYTIANDVSARDLQSGDGQWTRAKGLDTFCPLGPFIVTADDIPDPQSLVIQTQVNGQLMQDGHTRDMVFGVAELVSYLSRMFTLNAGDVILTGTPSGVGKAMNPPQFLKLGDTVSITIPPIGTLTNGCEELV